MKASLAEWVVETAGTARPGAAASIFGDASRRRSSARNSGRRRTTGRRPGTGSSAISTPRLERRARIGPDAVSAAMVRRGVAGDWRRAKSSAPRPGRVAKMALPGRWSPRPDEGAVHHTAHHIKRTGEGFPTCRPARAAGRLFGREEEEYEDYGDDDAEEIANVGLPLEAEEAESAIMYDKVVPGGDGAGAQATKEEAVE